MIMRCFVRPTLVERDLWRVLKGPPPLKNQNEKCLQFITVLSKNCLNKAIINRKRKGKRAYFSVFNFKYESISYFFSALNLRALSSRQ